ncbi:MAG TPA: hypothetical protein VJU54_03860 [Nitrospiraceae bacterium]|nr:hypothetical protein [Nitrospiraceae bacterium]
MIEQVKRWPMLGNNLADCPFTEHSLAADLASENLAAASVDRRLRIYITRRAIGNPIGVKGQSADEEEVDG